MNKKLHCYKFTFLELMIVIIIISVMVAIAAPRFGGFYSHLKLENNAKQLKLFFMYARNTALAKKRICKVYYVAKDQEFLLKIQSDPAKYPDEYENVDGIYKKLKLSPGTKLVGAQESGALPVPKDTDFNFDIKPLGAKSSYLFTLGDRDDNKINIVILAGSGMVKIYKKGQLYDD